MISARTIFKPGRLRKSIPTKCVYNTLHKAMLTGVLILNLTYISSCQAEPLDAELGALSGLLMSLRTIIYLESPADQSHLIASSTIEFRWHYAGAYHNDPVQNLDYYERKTHAFQAYRLQLSTDQNFTDIVQSQDTAASFVDLTLPATPAGYYWRIGLIYTDQTDQGLADIVLYDYTQIASIIIF